MEMVASNAQRKGRAEICQEASQELGQLPAGRSRLLSSSVGRGEEVSGQSSPVNELNFQPLSSSYRVTCPLKPYFSWFFVFSGLLCLN